MEAITTILFPIRGYIPIWISSSVMPTSERIFSISRSALSTTRPCAAASNLIPQHTEYKLLTRAGVAQVDDGDDLNNYRMPDAGFQNELASWLRIGTNTTEYICSPKAACLHVASVWISYPPSANAETASTEYACQLTYVLRTSYSVPKTLMSSQMLPPERVPAEVLFTDTTVAWKLQQTSNGSLRAWYTCPPDRKSFWSMHYQNWQGQRLTV